MVGRVLMLDDDGARRETIAAILRRDFHHVAEAGDIAAARRMLNDFRPDVVVVSIAGRKAGLAAAGEMAARAAERAPPIGPQAGRQARPQAGPRIGMRIGMRNGAQGGPLVVLSTGAGAEDRLAAFGRGVVDVVAYPPHPGLLRARVRSLLRIKAMTDELSRRDSTARALGLAAATRVGGRRSRVLIVASDPARAAGMRASLASRLDARMDVAAAGFEAVAQVERTPPDAVLVLDDAITSGVSSGAGSGAGFAEARDDAIATIRAVADADGERRGAVMFVTGGGVGGSGHNDTGDGDEGEADRRAAEAFDAGAADLVRIPGVTGAGDAELVVRLRAMLARLRAADGLRASLEDGLRRAASDPLTNLPNRRYFDAHAARAVASARDAGAPLVAMICDLDRFKAINDECGHGAGDRALEAFAASWRRRMRSSDLLCRYGGEEFVALMPATTAAEACTVAERVRATTAAIGLPEALRLTVSIGVASLSPGDRDAGDLIARADRALRTAKDEGRNTVRAA